jgi:membrane protein DedA with SNARE-associated domain/membrane-associated phospholipid phosphatase
MSSAKLLPPVLENLIKDFAQSLGSWAYLFVAVMAVAETAAFVGFIAPGEFTIILGGVLAGEGTLSIGLLIGIVWASIVTGDSIGFLLGRRLGRGFAIKHGHRIRLSEERIQRVERYFERHGGKTIFVGRWIGFVRPLMPFTAGASGMPYRRFIPYDILSAGLFGSFFCLLGFIFWHSLDKVSAIAGKGALGFGILAALIIGGIIAFKRLRDPADRRRFAQFLERLGRRPLVRPLASVLIALWRAVLRPFWRWVMVPAWRLLLPPLRFAGHRLTPGELGIEFTTLLAIAAVSTYVFGLYTDVVQHGHTFGTPGDDVARDIARDINAGVLTTLAKTVSLAGTWPFATAVLVVAGLFLIARARLVDTIVLAIGFGATQAGVQIAKAAVDRPRPAGPLVDAGGSSFPSGHAATAILYIALALAVARLLERSAVRIAVVAVACVLAVLIGLSRIYLRVHYLSDVNAGWALALALFSIFGAIAMVVSYLRNNAPVGDAPRANPTR